MPLTEEGNHSKAAVLDLCGLQAERLLGIRAARQAKRVKGATCKAGWRACMYVWAWV